MRPAWLVVLLVLLLGGCRAEVRRFSTWATLGQKPGKVAPVEIESPPPAHAFPWAGTVSHHLLADNLIDRWFAELAKRRAVHLFYILSPSHWGLSTLRYSLTDGSWHVPGGYVESDRPDVSALAKALGIPLESAIFEGEHGVSTLMPYIARYFPKAKVIAIAYRGEPPLDEPMAHKLALAIAPAFDKEGKKTNFLLISTDFAHHGNEKGTELKDVRTRKFFANPSSDTWIFAGCDNRPGIYVLAYVLGSATRCSILYHSNSLRLSGQGATNITSYFFTFFWDQS